MARIGRWATAVVTVAAALVGLLLGVRAELRAGDEEQRAVREEWRAREEREKVYAEHVDFYRLTSGVVVVNSSARVMNMRLILRDLGVWWDLEALLPCKQILIPNKVLLRSMAQDQPSSQLTDADFARLRLEFIDPNGKGWVRSSGGAVSRTVPWGRAPGRRPGVVSSEVWNVRSEDSPGCGSS